MVFPLRDDFIIGNVHFRLKNRRNARNSLEFIENMCTHCAMPIVFTYSEVRELEQNLDFERGGGGRGNC